MKLKKIIGICSAFAILAGGGAMLLGGKKTKSNEVKATTDIGTVTISEVRNAISNASTIYLLPTQNYGLPDSWDHAYTGVGDENGIFIDGVKQSGALKYAGTGSAFITFYYGLPSAAVEGTVVEFKGTFASEASGYSFTINYTAQRFAETWVHGLEDYDIVSLADANMPDFAAGAAINTDDMGSDYNYVTDPAGLPKQKGFLGLTNSTGSYAFQFNHKKTSTGTGWAHVLIGGQGPLWNSGHFMDFGFLDSWATTGHAQIREYKGNGNNWAADELYATGAIALGWNVGETNLLEMGLIKVKGSSQYYVFFKVNNVLKFGEYWTLDSTAGGMTTKVTFQYAGTDASFTNSITPVSTKLSPSTYVSEAKQLYLNMQVDACPAVNNWDDYFKGVDANNLKLNGSSVGYSNWNYFKKTGSQQMFIALGDIGITPVSGDILYIGGMFKAARTVNGVNVLFKVNFAPSYFEFDGENWNAINPNYEAADFAKDLLKLTSAICSASSSGNHDALASVWEILADGDHYSSLMAAEKLIIKTAEIDKTVVVPSTSSEIDEMLPEEAIGAAMYRYEYCGAKYNLDNFINRTYTVVFSNNMYSEPLGNTYDMVLIIVVLSTISMSMVGLLIFKRKRR